MVNETKKYLDYEGLVVYDKLMKATIDKDSEVIATALTDLDNRIQSIEAASGEQNVQSNWTESDDSSDAFILNKPLLGTAAALNVASSGNASDTEVVKGNDSRLSDARNPNNHASNKVTSLTGYSKPNSTSALSTNDSLNDALGKLEKALDGTVQSSDLYETNNIIKSEHLPSYVDDIIEGYYDNDSFYSIRTGDSPNYSYSNQITGESGKIYIDLGTTPSNIYRWGGSSYVQVNSDTNSAHLQVSDTSNRKINTQESTGNYI